MKSILVPTDFSDQAGYAIELATQFAKKSNASLQLLHVVEQPGSHYMTAVSGGTNDRIDNVYVLRLIERVKAQLQSLINNLEKEGVKAKYQIKIGNPFRHISSEIKTANFDLIVMGTQGISGLDEVLVGSNTEKVIRHASCPVITLKSAVDLDNVNNLVFAIGQFGPNERLASELKKIQTLFGAKAHLVTVNTPGNFLVQRDVMERLNGFTKEYQLDDITVNVYNDITEEEGILHFAEDSNADVIAMGTHRRTGLGHLLAGSISENMVNHANLPVVTFPLKLKEKET